MNKIPSALLLLSALPWTPGLTQPAVPDALEPWRDWVLFGLEYRACPVLNGRAAADPASHVCAWPGELAVEVATNTAEFTQNWTLYKEEWLPLPGNARYWPAEVTVDGVPQAAVLRSGRPMVRAVAGARRVAGELRFDPRPASIPVPVETGLVALTTDGAAVPLPQLENGTLWLGLRPDLVVEEDRLSVEVYRKLSDTIPLRVETYIALDVAGQSRELELTGALLPDFVGEAINSPLPAELDADGTLRIQVRPGRWQATLVAHHPEIVATLARPAVVAPWPEEEIWSFESNPILRVTVLEGAPAVDSQRAGVPSNWRALPSFAVDATTALSLVERSRNDALDDNQLQLARYLWLDFDGEGFTTQDAVLGQLRSRWRLDMAPPYTMTSAAIGNEQLLVTEGDAAGTQGVELRTTGLNLVTTARLPSARELPVTGYADDFDAAATTLFLPPAYRLIAAPGADLAVGAWIERWRLLDIFLALIIAVASWRLLGPAGGAIALATMLLVFHEPWAPRYVWLNLLLITALLRLIPPGRLHAWGARYRFVSVAALVLLLVPFTALQLRAVVFPQLEQSYVERGIGLPSVNDSFFNLGASVANLRGLDVNSGSRTLQLEQGQRAFARESADAAPADLNMTPTALVGRVDRFEEGASAAYAADAAAGVVNVILDAEGVSRYQPGALVQTGPGLPDWAWSRYTLGFSGPIAADQTYSLVIFGPWLVGLWRVASVALALALAWLLLRPALDLPRMGGGRGAAAGGTRSAIAGGTAIAGVIVSGLALLAVALPRHAEAQTSDAFPPLQLLDELRTRLTTPAPCHPACAELTDAAVSLTDDNLRLELEIALQDAVAVPIPGSAQGWRPEQIAIDGASRRLLYRDSGGQAWIRLDAGVHRVRLAGPLPAGDSLSLPFPLPPRRIEVEAPGWDIAGVSEARLASGTLEFIRQRQAEDGADEIRATAFPPYVQVTRNIRYGIDWTATTIVQRIAPRDGAFTLAVALLPDEAVVTENIEVEDGMATVAFAAGQSTVSWQSRLPTGTAMTLTAAAEAPWSERWLFNVGYEWHAEFDGLPMTRALLSGNLSLATEYLPRPGETLNVALTRPEPASGDTIAIDEVVYNRSVGARSTGSALDFVYRSTRAAEHPLTLPAGSELESVAIDGIAVPLRLDGTLLTLPVTPGEHLIDIVWGEPTGVGWRSHIAAVDLGAGASNLTTRINLPADRWVLFTYGPTLGPAVLYWAELAVFVLAALILGRIALSPLKTHEWLLLGLGLSTFSWPVLVLFAGWAFLMSWRSRKAPAGHRWLFNTGQVLLALLTLGVLVALIRSIMNGLLGSPEMHISTPVDAGGTPGGNLYWFLDRSAGATPSAGAISVSLWFYKAAMLAWALWLSFALLRWLRFAWTAFGSGGLWLGKVRAAEG